jgi:hypothetical protein
MTAEQIEPLMTRIAPLHANLCAIRRDGGPILWIARDIFAALGVLDNAALAEYKAQPSHDAGMSAHCTEAAAFELDVISPAILDWAPDQATADLLIAHMEFLSGVRRRDPGKRAWEMAEAAKILDADPGIETSFTRLRDWLHVSTWLDFDGTYYKPSALAAEQGLLAVRKDRIPNHDEPYPTVLVTERGIRALHERLGGIARLDLDHHHPLLPGMAAHL